MEGIFKKVLFPGVLSVILVLPFGFISEQFLSYRPQVFTLWGHARLVFYWYMTPGFLVGGALGAWVSRYLGGDLRERLASGGFLALAGLGACILPLPLAFAIDPHVSSRTFSETLTGHIFSQAVVPSIPLLLGSSPFLFSSSERPDGAVAA